MSGQWEVVGKKKDKNAKLPAGKSAKDVRKKQLPHQPKLEDVCELNNSMKVANIHGFITYIHIKIPNISSDNIFCNNTSQIFAHTYFPNYV